MNNIIISPHDFKHLNIGLAQSMKEHRNILYVHNLENDFGIGNQLKNVQNLLHQKYHVPKSLINQYYFKQDEAGIGIIKGLNHGLHLQAEDVTRIVKYPHLLFRHQPFFFQINTDDNEKPDQHFTYQRYLVYIINQIMYFIRKHPSVNQNGLDVVIFSLYRVPMIARLCLYLRDGNKYNVRFLMGVNYKIALPYSMTDGYGKDDENADSNIFNYSKNYSLMIKIAKYNHQQIPKLIGIW